MATFQQVPMQQIINRLEKSHHVCEDLLKSLGAYADLHDKVANSTHKIARPNIYENEIFRSSTERALGFLKNYFLFTAREYANYTQSLNDNVCKALEAFLGEEASKNMEFKILSQQAMKEVASATEKHARVRRGVTRTQHEVQAAQQKLVQQMESGEHNDLDRLQSKLKRLQDEQRLHDSELRASRNEVLPKIQSRDKALAASAERFQLYELTRLQLLKKQLNSFIDYERKLLESRMSLLSTFEQAVEGMNPVHDLQLFTERNKDPDQVHRYSRALSLLDWDYQRRKPIPKSSVPSAPALVIPNPNAPDGDSNSSPQDSANDEGSQEEQDALQIKNQVRDGLAPIFSSLMSPRSLETTPAVQTPAEINWKTLLSGEVGRQQLVKLLNENRMGSSLSADAFKQLGKVLVDLLDTCLIERDVKSAMQASNMGNTFFVAHDEQEDHIDSREYLYNVLKDHQIWRTRHFWEDALMQGVAEQFDMFPTVRWDELGTEELKEAVIRVHNTVYGQLGSLAFNMKNVGMSKDEIEDFMISMSRRSELTEDQELELLRNIRSIFGPSQTPNAAPAPAPEASDPLPFSAVLARNTYLQRSRASSASSPAEQAAAVTDEESSPGQHSNNPNPNPDPDPGVDVHVEHGADSDPEFDML